MNHAIGSMILLFFGVGLLIVAWRGNRSGELRAGSAGWRPYRPNRMDNPLGFRFYFFLYVAAGIVLTVWGVLAMLGAAPPLDLR
ncbi:MAG TPA: hypothetical protein VE046_07910 [Steroidobacteraceae bacterium]|nr:hypothetical protein [Steroidobacteraceae bacterium]